MGELVTLTDDYGYRDYRVAHIERTVIDASAASWTVANIGLRTNKYPFLVDKSDGITAIGGTITGEVSLELDWLDAYENSAAVFMRDTKNTVISDWTITQAWDAIRIDGDADNFRIENIYLQDIRDDSVENDDGLNGTISSSLFDGVFVGISLADPWSEPSIENLVSIDNLLMRMETFKYKGQITHGAMLKVDATSPAIEIFDSVFAVTDANHIDQWRVRLGWEKVLAASGNYLLNLSDQPFPPDYPLPHHGFKILQGAQARAHWDSVSTAWLACHRDNAHSGGNCEAEKTDR